MAKKGTVTLEYQSTGKAIEGKKANKNYVFGFAYKKLLYSGKTKFQKIELFDTPWMGKLLKLDRCFQTSEKDDFFYHEAMTHPAMSAHHMPKNILIIGGGDGGILKNVIWHKSVKSVKLVEIDEGVIRFSKEYLKSIHQNSLSDVKAKIIIGDGKKFIEKTKEKFDIIIADLTDPIGPAKALYTREFYKKVSTRLCKNGIFSSHLDLVTTRPQLSRWIYQNLRAAFKFARPFVSYIPLYGSLMAFCINSNFLDAKNVDAKIIKNRLTNRHVPNLKWYSSKMHQAMFVLPPYLEKLFSSEQDRKFTFASKERK